MIETVYKKIDFAVILVWFQSLNLETSVQVHSILQQNWSLTAKEKRRLGITTHTVLVFFDKVGQTAFNYMREMKYVFTLNIK